MILTTKIQSGKTIYDYSNILLGGFDNLITLIKLNPNFESINVDLDDFATRDIVYDDQFYQDKTVQIQLPVIGQASTLKTINGLDGQNLYDLNLMSYGSFDKLVKFLIDNNINSINNHAVVLKEFTFDLSLNNNLSLRAVVAKRGYVFATGIYQSSVSGYLQKEDGFYILQENGFKIYL